MYCRECGAAQTVAQTIDGTEAPSRCGQCGADIAALPSAASPATIKFLSMELYRNQSWIKFVAVAAIVSGSLLALTLVGLVIAWLPIWTGIVLYRAAGRLEEAGRTGSREAFTASLSTLGTYFRINAIISALTLAVVPLIILLAVGLSLPSFLRNLTPSHVDLTGLESPAFDVKDLDGTPYTLAELKGRPVLLDFWATWCPPCRVSMPTLDKIHEEYKEHGLVVLGIDVGESRKTVEQFMKTTHIPYPVVMGSEFGMPSAFQVTAFPTFVLIGPDGKIVAHQVGFSGEAGLIGMLEKAGLPKRQATLD